MNNLALYNVSYEEFLGGIDMGGPAGNERPVASHKPSSQPNVKNLEEAVELVKNTPGAVFGMMNVPFTTLVILKNGAVLNEG